MSALTTAIERELGAVPLTFPTVRKGLLWHVEQKAKRHGRAMSFNGGGCRPPQVTIDQQIATFAAIEYCLVERQPDVDLDDEFRLYPRRIVHLVSWYMASAKKDEAWVIKGVQVLADDMRMSPAEASEYCGFTESVIRRRMDARGLILREAA